MEKLEQETNYENFVRQFSPNEESDIRIEGPTFDFGENPSFLEYAEKWASEDPKRYITRNYPSVGKGRLSERK